MHDIDAVITWVDGTDPKHKQKLDQYHRAEQPHLRAAEPTRYRDSGEIYVCLASIAKFAPFIRHIFLVTDDQRPPLLEDTLRATGLTKNVVTLVDHREIFKGYEQYLPTFNSISIETMLHRIEGLAEQFVYFNDDVFLARPLGAETFFRNGLPVLRTRKKVYFDRRPDWLVGELKNRLKKSWKVGRPDFRLSQQMSARMVGGFARYHQVTHQPHPMRRSPLRDFFANNAEALDRQLSYRFRDRAQFSAISLSNHLEIRRYDLTPEPFSPEIYVEARIADASDVKRIFDAGDRVGAPWGCLQNVDEASPETYSELTREIRKRFPELSEIWQS